MTRTIVHLLDDASPGGITRMLEHLTGDPVLARTGRHEVRVLRRGALAATRLDADVVVSHLAVSWANLALLTSLRAMNPATPLVHVEHHYTERFVAANVPARRRFEALMGTAFALFDRVVAVSEPQRAWIVRRGFVPARKIEVIEPCVDLAPFLAIDPSFDGPLRRFALLGRLDTQKGFDVALSAFRAVAGANESLAVCGEGPERERLVRLAAGDPRIAFTGWRPPAEALADVDAVLVPSRWEAFGLVALEAQAAGRLVLTSGVDGLARTLRHGAVEVAPMTREAWAEAISAACGMDRASGALRGRARARAASGAFAACWTRLVETLTTPEMAAV